MVTIVETVEEGGRGGGGDGRGRVLGVLSLLLNN
jgi:hypothetical protein